jgi:hypothetical protein
MIGNFKIAIVILMGIMFFDDVMTARKATGIILTLAGLVYFALAKTVLAAPPPAPAVTPLVEMDSNRDCEEGLLTKRDEP